MENAIDPGPIAQLLEIWSPIIAPWTPIIAIVLFIWRCSGWISGLKKILDDMKSSLSKIETAITQVDLKTMEHDISVLIGARTPSSIGNTVVTVLKQSGIRVSVSLINLGDPSEVSMRFSHRIEGLGELIIEDEYLAKREKELFGAEVTVIPYSPRGIKFEIPSQDTDSIVIWTKELLEKIDYFVKDIGFNEEVFDKKLKELL